MKVLESSVILSSLWCPDVSRVSLWIDSLGDCIAIYSSQNQALRDGDEIRCEPVYVDGLNKTSISFCSTYLCC